jgi:DNA-binding FadR family transcriptional regulator
MAEAVFDELARMIISGKLSADSSLPAERELSERFGVSRLIVRQAIHRLADLGLVRVRQGGATMVVDPSESDHPLVSVLALKWSPERDELVQDLQERQVVGSLGMVILAARKCSQRDGEGLIEMLDEAALDKEAAETLNQRFWQRIAELTENAFFKRETSFWFRMASEDERLEQRVVLPIAVRFAAFRRIAEALVAGEGAARAHLNIIEALLDTLGSRRG